MSSTEEGVDKSPANPTTMLRREQQVGYVLAGVAAAGAAAVGAFGQHHLLLTALGLTATVLYILAVRRGHRILTAIAGFATALAFFYFFPLELALLLFSAYLMMRTSNAQGKIRRSQPPLTAAQRREAAAARAAARAQRRKGPAGEVVVVKTPPPNRRYTPPKGKPTRRP